MRETIEFRIPESRAGGLLEPADGLLLGRNSRIPVRKIVLPLDDPRVELIGQRERERRLQGEVFFTYWRIRRQYTVGELEAAELLQVRISSKFEPTGEECGTAYDYSDECPICGAGRRQVSQLALDLGRIRPGRDFAETIAGDEWVVSSRAKDLLEKHRLTGLALIPIRHTGRGGSRLPTWYQLRITSSPIGVDSCTRFGVNPFHEGHEARYQCPLGHVLGLNLISELHVKRDHWDDRDLVCTRQFIGMRQGLLVPHPVLLVSGRAWRLLKEEEVTGFEVEVVHLT